MHPILPVWPSVPESISHDIQDNPQNTKENTLSHAIVAYDFCLENSRLLRRWPLKEERELVGFLSSQGQLELFLLKAQNEEFLIEQISQDKIQGGINGSLSIEELVVFLEEDSSLWEVVLQATSSCVYKVHFLPRLAGGMDAPTTSQEEDLESIHKKLTNVENRPTDPHSVKELQRAFEILQRGSLGMHMPIPWDRFFKTCTLIAKVRLTENASSEVYSLCHKFCEVLVEKEKAFFYRNEFLELLKTIRAFFSDAGQRDLFEEYLSLGITFCTHIGAVEKQFELIREGGKHTLSLAEADGDFKRYFRASFYYALAYRLTEIHPVLSMQADQALQELLAVQGEYLRKKTQDFKELIAYYENEKCSAAVVDKLSWSEKEQLLSDIELIAEVLVIRGCNSVAYRFYGLASSLNERFSLTKRRFSLVASDIFAGIPEDFLLRAQSPRQKLISIREECATLVAKEEKIPVEEQKRINHLYAEILIQLFQEGVLLLDPKKEHAFTLMSVGSLSRGEMCPFSDFEVMLLKGEISLEQTLTEMALTNPKAEEIVKWAQLKQLQSSLSFADILEERLQQQSRFRQILEETKNQEKQKENELEEAVEKRSKEEGLTALLDNIHAKKRAQRKSFNAVVEKQLEEYKSFEQLLTSAKQRQREENGGAGPLSKKSSAFFKTLAEFFQLQVLFLGETEWSLIKGKKSLLPKGFSLDASNNLLTLCDLPEKLVLRQSQEAKGEDVVQLNVLRSAQFLVGSRALAESYETLLKKKLDENGGALRKKHALNGIEYYLNQLDISLNHMQTIDVKNKLLRFPVLVFEALCLYYGIPTNCHTCDKIAALCQKGVLPSSLQEPLQSFLEFAFYLRWRVHLKEGEEIEELELLPEEDKTLLAKIAEGYQLILNPLKETLKEWLTEPTAFQPPEPFAIAHLQKGKKCLSQEDYEKARYHLQLAASLKEDKTPCILLGQLAFFLGHFQEAKTAWEKGISAIDKVLWQIPKGAFPSKEALQLAQTKEKLIRLVHLVQDQVSMHQTLEEALKEVGHEESPVTFEKELILGENTLDTILKNDLIGPWKNKIKRWLTLLFSQPNPLENFKKIYAALPKIYRKEVKQEILSEFSDKVVLLESFFCDEGYIFSPHAKRQAWLGAFAEEIKQRSLENNPPATFARIEGVHVTKGYLREAIKDHLFQGREFKNALKDGRRPVNKTKTTYFKQNPASPGDEYAVYLLNHLITAQGSPPVEILRVVVSSQEHLLLASQAVAGEALHYFMSTYLEFLTKLDKKNFSSMFLMALLIDPEDGKADNYIATYESTASGEVENLRLVGIDNDHAFVKPFIQKGVMGGEQLFIKTILFCLDQMKEPLHAEVAAQFLALDPTAVLEEWLELLSAYNKKIGALFNEETLNGFWKEGILVPFFMHPDQVLYLHEKMQRIQGFLAKGIPTHIDLLKYVNVKVANLYEEALAQPLTPRKRFEMLTKDAYRRKDHASFTLTTTTQIKKYTLKTLLETLHQFRVNCFTPEEGLKVLHLLSKDKEEQDDGEKKALARLLREDNGSHKILTTPLQEEMLRKKDWVNAPSHELEKFGGIAFRKVSLRNYQALKDADLEKFLKSSVHFVTGQVEMQKLNLRGCLALTNKCIDIIRGTCPKLEKLSLEGTLVKNAEFTHRTTPYLRQINLRKCTELSSLKFKLPYLQALFLAGCTQLKTLRGMCPHLELLEIKECPTLKEPDLGSIEMSPNVFALLKDLQENPPSRFILKEKVPDAVMKMLLKACHFNADLHELSLYTEEGSLSPQSTLPEEIDLSGHPALFSLEVQCHSLKKLLLSHIKNLQTIVLETHLLQELRLEGCSSLKSLRLDCPKLSKISLKGCHIQEYRSSKQTPFTSRFLKTLQGLQNEQITALEITSLTELEEVVRTVEQHRMSVCTKDSASSLLGQLLTVFKNSSSLSYLALHNLPIDELFLRALAKAMEGPLPLAQLELPNAKMLAFSAELLAEALKTSRFLTQLNLKKNLLGNEGTVTLVKALENNRVLKSLDLSANNIGNEGAHALASLLKSNSSWTHLYLAQNSIGTSGGRALAQSLKENSTLLHLDIRGNTIETEGIHALAHVLSSHPSLTSIDLWENHFSLKGGETLANCLRDKIPLVLVEEGKKKQLILELLAPSPRLKHLALEKIPLNAEWMGFLLGIFQQKKEQIHSLSLRGAQLEGDAVKALAQVFSDSTTLTTLDLGENSITPEGAVHLAKALESNKSLTRLDLSSNWIGLTDLKPFAKSLAVNTALASLSLANNKIRDGMEELAQALENKQALTSLDLSRNRIDSLGTQALVQALQRHRGLTELDLSRNEIDQAGALALASLLTQQPALTSLQLNRVKMGREGALALAKALQDKPFLIRLELENCQLGAGISSLLQTLETKSRLASLDLSKNEIGKEELSSLAKALQEKHALTSLNLTKIELGVPGGKALAATLKHITSLTALDVEDCRLGNGIQDLAYALEECTALAQLNLRKNGIQAQGVLAVAHLCAQAPKLLHIDLSGNKIPTKTVNALIQALEPNTSLTGLNWNGVEVGKEGPYLAHMLKNKKHLKTLYLEDTKLDLSGVKALAQALAMTSSLTNLNLGGNAIGDEGIVLLAKALIQAPLIRLDLGNNLFDTEGIKALAELLENIQTLQTLNLPSNGIDTAQLALLFPGFANNPSLAYLSLEDNLLEDQAATALAQAFKTSRSLTLLNLQGNGIQKEGAIALGRLLKSVSSLNHLDLSGNPLSLEAVARLESFWQGKKCIF